VQLELFPEPQLQISGEIDRYLVMFSGGKDSLYLLLWAIENLDISKLEVWHHLVDGRESNLMDWECTESYVRVICKYFNLPLYFSWLEGGFERELLRDNQPKSCTFFETPDGLQVAGGNGKPNTRLRFPAKVSDLRTRWCSAYLKIDVARTAIVNQKRFDRANLVVLTGERREESQARSKYREVGYYMQPTRHRTVYQHRAILDRTESEVWAKIHDSRLPIHPAYLLGFPRLSCRACIFSSPQQWATIARDYHTQFERISKLERELNHTIDSKYSIVELARQGTPYPLNHDVLNIATNREYQFALNTNLTN
jgi:3'-phosphoadenosine 5'-phosphosulfate sulfotransferase (PAPS reductase)/FAD synthetase